MARTQHSEARAVGKFAFVVAALARGHEHHACVAAARVSATVTHHMRRDVVSGLRAVLPALCTPGVVLELGASSFVLVSRAHHVRVAGRSGGGAAQTRRHAAAEDARHGTLNTREGASRRRSALLRYLRRAARLRYHRRRPLWRALLALAKSAIRRSRAAMLFWQKSPPRAPRGGEKS
jgi:hypothetical protein